MTLRQTLQKSTSNGRDSWLQLVRNPLKMVETQREFVTETRRILVETTNELLQIARRASGAAVQPVVQRLQTGCVCIAGWMLDTFPTCYYEMLVELQLCCRSFSAYRPLCW